MTTPHRRRTDARADLHGDVTMPTSDGRPSPRTVLEQKIRERRLTLREFVIFAEEFARDNNEIGTLSFRHLQRLIAGKQSDGPLVNSLRPATTRLLERIFDERIEVLLAPPDHLSSTINEQHPYPLTVAIAVIAKGPETLIVCRRAADDIRIMWQFPAGVVKPGASAESVAVQETHRETGVHCSVSRPLGRRVHPVTGVVCEYLLCEYIAGEAQNSDIEENLSVTWIANNRLPRVIPNEQIYPPILEALGIA